MKPIRIAVVQYGDYLEAVQSLHAGVKEPYAGMRHSVEALQELFGDLPHLVISLNARSSRQIAGHGRYVGLAIPQPRLWRRGILNMQYWADQVCAELESFGPTHVLMRAAGDLALRILKFSTRHDWSVLVMFANAFHSPDRRGQQTERRLAEYLNHPSVDRVANHRKISTRSMVERGVRAEKVVAYDWPGARCPSQFEVKRLDSSRPIELLYAANMIRAKGIGDLIEAVAILHRRKLPIHLTAFGVGKDQEMMRRMAEKRAPGLVDFPGQVDNDELFGCMRNCTVACITSRPEFQEGGSLALTEALASRTPVVLSNQPLFQRTFQAGEGIEFFQAGDCSSLARAIEHVATDEQVYAHLSNTTRAAFSRAVCDTTFVDVIRQWKRGWTIDKSYEQAAHALSGITRNIAV